MRFAGHKYKRGTTLNGGKGGIIDQRRFLFNLIVTYVNFWNKYLKCRNHFAPHCRRKLQREARQPFPPATGAWTRVGTDLFKMQGTDYLLIVDYHTNYPEISLLPDTTSATIREIRYSGSGYIRQWSTICTQAIPRIWKKIGILRTLYRVPIIRKRMVKLNVWTVQTINHYYAMTEEDPYLASLNSWACPGPDGTPAPATKLMNRPICTRLPRVGEETSH